RRHPYNSSRSHSLHYSLPIVATCMQRAKNHHHARFFQLRMQVDRHAATSIRALDRTVLVERDANAFRVPGERFIDRVVDHFLGKVVGALGVGVHAGALAHRLEAGENFDILGSIVIAHVSDPGYWLRRYRRMPQKRNTNGIKASKSSKEWLPPRPRYR